jgi:hypothetical protein
MKLSAMAAALALSLPLTALAGVTSTAQIGNFRVEVIDLDLNDGIAAALTLDDAGKVLTAGYNAGAGFPDPFEYLTDDGSVTATTAAGSATASLQDGTGNVSADYAGITGELFGTVAVGHGFTLTANTQVILYADASATGGTGAGPGEAWGSANALLFSTFDGPATGESVQVEDYLLSYLGNTAQRQLSVTFSSGAAGLEGELGYATAAYAGISPVPEPSQVALLTLGLAGLGWRLRRVGRTR